MKEKPDIENISAGEISSIMHQSHRHLQQAMAARHRGPVVNSKNRAKCVAEMCASSFEAK